MLSPETITYQLEIYTHDACWRGGLNYSKARRLSDLLNDLGHGYIDLERADLITWDGRLPKVVDTFGAISVSKKNAIAIVCYDPPTEAPAKTTEHVIKVPRRVALYAPPIAIVGNLHAVVDAHLISVLDASRLPFLPITSAHVVRTDGQPPLSTKRALVLVNRGAITAVQSLPPESEGSEIDSLASVSAESRGSRMISVANKISHRNEL